MPLKTAMPMEARAAAPESRHEHEHGEEEEDLGGEDGDGAGGGDGRHEAELRAVEPVQLPPSTVASSGSMIGMSSRTGYTRLH